MRAWLEQTLAAVRTTAVPAPQAALRCIRQRGFDGACYRGLVRNGQPLRLKGTVYPAGIGMATDMALRVELPSSGRRFTCRVPPAITKLSSNIFAGTIGLDVWLNGEKVYAGIITSAPGKKAEAPAKLRQGANLLVFKSSHVQ